MRIHLTLVLHFTLYAIMQSEQVNSANILFYSLLSSYSHRICMWPLVEALAAKGHNVTFIQSFPPKTPNPLVREFYPKSLGRIWDHIEEDQPSTPSTGNPFFQIRVTEGPFAVQKYFLATSYIGLRLCDVFLSQPEVSEFVKSNKFDLVIIDSHYNECAYGLAHKWGAKTILYFTTAPSGTSGIETHGFLASAEPWISNQVVPLQMPMSFMTRVKNMLVMGSMYFIKISYFYPRLQTLLESKLNISNMPPVTNLLEATSLVFYNGHFAEEEARALPPKFVSVPALHAWDAATKQLPKDLSQFIEGSGDAGFIYVSFGGEANFSTTPPEFQNIFIKVFSEMPVRFIWKRPSDTKIQMPANVLIKDWMPQKDILASPKCRGFITHGGLLGTQEAILSGVPMIAMPIFAEQDYNANRLERTGRGIKIEAYGLTEAHLRGAIEELLRNKSYKENVEKARTQLRDLQNRPIDTAVFWTEYVLRHDTSSLQPLGRRDMYWFQTQFLDVWAFLVLVFFTFSFFFLTAVSYAFKRVYCRFSKTVPVKTKVN